MPEKQPDLLDAIAREPVLAARLRAMEGTLPHIVEHAQPTLCAAIARVANRRVWFVCQNVRSQEALHNELTHWHPGALFFPELEIAPVEGALPDPEAVAERLGVIQKLAATPSKKNPLILVLTRKTLDDEVVDEAALRKLELHLVRGKKTDRDAFLKKLGHAGYEPVAQVTARGQFAIRGGIVDVFSFHHSLPIRLEWFDDELESIRQFSLDSQTSIEQLPTCTLLLGEAESVGKKLADYIRSDDLTVDVDASWDDGKLHITSDVVASGEFDFNTAFYDHGLGEFEAGDFVVDVQ